MNPRHPVAVFLRALAGAHRAAAATLEAAATLTDSQRALDAHNEVTTLYLAAHEAAEAAFLVGAASMTPISETTGQA